MWIISICFCAALAMSLTFCLCWRRKQHKSEWMGLDGMVTQKNPDENVNNLPAVSSSVDGSNSSSCKSSLNKRFTASANTKRSLPDIPAEQDVSIQWEPTGDSSSEHYATLGQYQNAAKKQIGINGLEVRASISQQSSISQADDSSSPYERVKYGAQEHPYAQLKPTSSRVPNYEDIPEDRTSLLRGDETLPDGPGPSRSRRSSTNNNLAVDIPAASAVAGGIAASPELPYMTPPVTQPNFSGDSQDSSKGYTSITVREPLANIIAETKAMHKKKEIDVHYSTVSDDSDDFYTTIPDQNQIYTSESETYARIPAGPITVEAEVVAPAQGNGAEIDILYEPAPQPPPPSVDSLKQFAHGHGHSRQASSSSSVANVGSPKPEKRQANSPLPPPPTESCFDFHDKPTVKNLDELYAKVHKNKKKDDSAEKRHLRPSSEKRSSPFSANEHEYEKLRKSTLRKSDPKYEQIQDEPGYASINGPESLNSSDPGYEVLKQAPSDIDPNYEQLRLKDCDVSDAEGYSKVNKADGSIDGYSVVNKAKKNGNKSRGSSNYDSNSQDISLDEPNYESMPSESITEPSYSILKSTESESDPNYESVDRNDPNYESVSYPDEPPYEKLNNDSSSMEVDVSGYERVGGACDTAKNSSNDDSDVPGYEKIRGGDLRQVNSSNSSKESDPNYETINCAAKSVHDADVFQV